MTDDEMNARIRAAVRPDPLLEELEREREAALAERRAAQGHEDPAPTVNDWIRRTARPTRKESR